MAARHSAAGARRPGPADRGHPVGYARCAHLDPGARSSQLDALVKHGIPRDKIFSEKISTRIRVRPPFEAALAPAREIKAHAPHCRGS